VQGRTSCWERHLPDSNRCLIPVLLLHGPIMYQQHEDPCVDALALFLFLFLDFVNPTEYWLPLPVSPVVPLPSERQLRPRAELVLVGTCPTLFGNRVAVVLEPVIWLATVMISVSYAFPCASFGAYSAHDQSCTHLMLSGHLIQGPSRASLSAV
jgi:hypothetical protein